MPRVVVSISLDEETYKLLDSLHEKTRQSKSQIIRSALLNYINNDDKKDMIEYIQRLQQIVEKMEKFVSSQECKCPDPNIDAEELERLRRENEELKKKLEEIMIEKEREQGAYDSFALEIIRDLRKQIGKHTAGKQPTQEIIIIAKLLYILEESIKNLRIPRIDDVLRKIQY